MTELLDQLEREFFESLMEALKVRRMSASETAAVRMRYVERRERSNAYVQVVVVAIGGEATKLDGCVTFLSSFFFVYISEVGECE